MDVKDELAWLMREWERTGGTAQIAESLADHYTKAKNHRTARRWYREAFRLAPDNNHLLDKLEDSVIRGIEGLVLKAQERRTARLTGLKMAQLRYTTISLERRVRAQPSDGRLHFELGRTYYIGGTIDLAMSEFGESLKNERFREGSYYYLARCFMKKRRFEDALLHLAKLEETLLSAELRADVRYQKSKCLGELGRSGEASDLFGS